MIAALVHAARRSNATIGSLQPRRPSHLSSLRWKRTAASSHSYRAGQAKAPATASDYANMIWGALRLYQATNEPGYLAAAERWSAVLDAHYWVADGGGYAFTADNTPDVIVRMRSALTTPRPMPTRFRSPTWSPCIC